MATLTLTKANRLKLAQAFRHNPRVDISIECVLEGQMGTVFVDAPQTPTVYRIAADAITCGLGARRARNLWRQAARV